MLEDAFVLRDRQALIELFEDGAVFVAGRDRSEARGAEAIARSVEALWSAERGYVAEPRRVVQTRGTALVLAAGGVSVLRRASNMTQEEAVS